MKPISDEINVFELKNDTLPYFNFYVNDWLTSNEVVEMTWAERGLYHGLLLLQWRCNNSIPTEPKKLAALLSTDVRTVNNWLAKWSRLFPQVEVDGTTPDKSVQNSGGCLENASGATVGMQRRANPKLCNVRIDIELAKLQKHRLDKSKGNKTKGDDSETKTTVDQTLEGTKSSSSQSSPSFSDVEAKPEAINLVFDTLNKLPYMKKYPIPSTASTAYVNVGEFCKQSDWKLKLDKLVAEYGASKWLQDGGSGCMTSITWLFGKNWINNVEKIIGGLYRPKKDNAKDAYNNANSFLNPDGTKQTEEELTKEFAEMGWK